MCGRFAFYLPPAELLRLFGCENLINFPPRYNAAPMQDHPVIIRNRMGFARWGLLPPWANSDGKALAAKMINARSETIAEKPSFVEGWNKSRRCLIPANGFYEWYGPEKEAVPYYIYRNSGAIMAMAGLWAKSGDLITFTILTKEASGPISAMHHRMPAMFDPVQAAEWFSADAETAMQMIQHKTIDDLYFHTVGRDVGKVANDRPDLITACTQPIPSPTRYASGRLV